MTAGDLAWTSRRSPCCGGRGRDDRARGPPHGRQPAAAGSPRRGRCRARAGRRRSRRREARPRRGRGRSPPRPRSAATPRRARRGAACRRSPRFPSCSLKFSAMRPSNTQRPSPDLADPRSARRRRSRSQPSSSNAFAVRSGALPVARRHVRAACTRHLQLVAGGRELDLDARRRHADDRRRGRSGNAPSVAIGAVSVRPQEEIIGTLLAARLHRAGLEALPQALRQRGAGIEQQPQAG